MAVRAFEVLEDAIIRPYTVATAKVAAQYGPVKHSGADNAVEDTAAVGDDSIGISQDVGAAGDVVRVALFGYGISKAKVTAGAATRGKPAGWGNAGGVEDIVVGGGNTKKTVCGQFLQTGASGDLVGLNLGMASFSVGA